LSNAGDTDQDIPDEEEDIWTIKRQREILGGRTYREYLESAGSRSD
jgi:hypothetical protein